MGRVREKQEVNPEAVAKEIIQKYGEKMLYDAARKAGVTQPQDTAPQTEKRRVLALVENTDDPRRQPWLLEIDTHKKRAGLVGVFPEIPVNGVRGANKKVSHLNGFGVKRNQKHHI